MNGITQIVVSVKKLYSEMFALTPELTVFAFSGLLVSYIEDRTTVLNIAVVFLEA